MTLEMWFVLAVIALPLLLVLFNRWRVDVAALFIIVALGLAQFLGFQILGDAQSPQTTLLAISGFSQPVVITLIGLFVLTQALTDNGVMLWLERWLAKIGTGSEARLVFVFTLLSTLLSLLMNNVAVGVLLLPSAISVVRGKKIRPSRLLIPIAFATALGGMVTYFTTANIVISNLLTTAQPPQEPLGVLSFAPTGGLIALAGIGFMVLFGSRLLPEREPGVEQSIARHTASPELEDLYSLGERLWEASVLQKSVLAGQTLKNSRIGEQLGVAVIAISRRWGEMLIPSADDIIRSGDTLLVVGREERVSKLAELGVRVEREIHSVSHFGVTLLESILAPRSPYVGKTLKEVNFRHRYGFAAIALLRRERSYRTNVADITLEPGDSLLMVGPHYRIGELRFNPNLIILEPDPAARPIPRRRAVISVLVFISAIVLSLLGLPVYLSVFTAALLTILLGLVPVQELYRSIEWQVVFFIAGMYAASLGMVHTGLAALVGRGALEVVGDHGPLGLAAVTFLISAALTQVMGSQATVFVIGPIAISAAIHLNANPQAIAVATAIGCSASFLTPIAHPVNLIMMGPGNYRFGDFFRVGLGLMLVVFFVLLAGMIIFWKL
jgi:di/tricarboxylate transporter